MDRTATVELHGEALNAAIEASASAARLDQLVTGSGGAFADHLTARLACGIAGGDELAARALLGGKADDDAARLARRIHAALAQGAPARVVPPESVVESALAELGHATTDAHQVATDVSALSAARPALHGILIAALGAGATVTHGHATARAERASAVVGALLLSQTGCTSGPWVAPSHLDAASRSALVQVDRSGAWSKWIRAWCGQLARACARTTADVARAADRFADDRRTVRAQPRVGATDQRVLDWMHQRVRFTIREAGAALGLTTPTVGASAERLQGRGLAVELTGQLRDRVWVARPALDLVSGV